MADYAELYRRDLEVASGSVTTTDHGEELILGCYGSSFYETPNIQDHEMKKVKVKKNEARKVKLPPKKKGRKEGTSTRLCPFCQTEMKMSPKFRIYDKNEGVNYDFSLTYMGKPDAYLFKEASHLPMHPQICPGCGFVALFVSRYKLRSKV